MNQNIPAPEPEQQQLSGETLPLATCQLSVQGTKQLCLQCPQVISYIIQAETTLARCIASYYEWAASLNAVCNVVLREKSGIMWHYKQYNPV